MSSILNDKALSLYTRLSVQYGRQSITTIAIAAISTASLLGLARAAYRDYKLFLSYGPGGVPHNALGWLMNLFVLGPFKSEMFSTDMYDGYEDKKSWLPDTGMQRSGERPIVGPHAVPQRQLSQVPSQEIQKKLVAAFDDLAKKNPDMVKVTQSKFERHTDALFLSDSILSSPIESLREISHIHGTSDHSVHVILSPLDCKKVIEAGWGQRHPLDGSLGLKRLTGFWLPKQYIYVYAPRNDGEIETVMRIVRASVAYMTGTEEVH